MGNDNIRPFVIPIQACRRQVVQLGQVSTAVPVNGQLRQFVQRPGVFPVALPKFIYGKVGPHSGGVHVQ